MGWDARVAWALLVLGSMMAARFAPSLAIDVPDEALLDLDRLAVTAWSARDSQRGGRRGRIVVGADAMERLVHRASRIVTGAAVAILVTVTVASPLLLRSATIDLDRIGARCLVFFAGCSLLLAARSYRHAAARALLRLAGLAALTALAVHLVAGPGGPHLGTFFYVVVALGVVALAAAVATGRGWRSVWWSRRAEVAESLCGSLALASAVVAAGVFRRLWENLTLPDGLAPISSGRCTSARGAGTSPRAPGPPRGSPPHKTLGRSAAEGEGSFMSEIYGQTEKALSKGADYVDQARGDVKNKCGVLSGNIQTMMAGWGGQGASAFNNLMISWDQKQETILKALDQLSASMKETERDNVSTDESQSATHTNLQGRLG